MPIFGVSPEDEPDTPDQCDWCKKPLGETEIVFRIRRKWIFVCSEDCKAANLRDYDDWKADQYD